MCLKVRRREAKERETNGKGASETDDSKVVQWGPGSAQCYGEHRVWRGRRYDVGGTTIHRRLQLQQNSSRSIAG